MKVYTRLFNYKQLLIKIILSAFLLFDIENNYVLLSMFLYLFILTTIIIIHKKIIFIMSNPTLLYRYKLCEFTK